MAHENARSPHWPGIGFRLRPAGLRRDKSALIETPLQAFHLLLKLGGSSWRRVLPPVCAARLIELRFHDRAQANEDVGVPSDTFLTNELKSKAPRSGWNEAHDDG